MNRHDDTVSGLVWPRYEDGHLLQFGDAALAFDGPRMVDAVMCTPGGYRLWRSFTPEGSHRGRYVIIDDGGEDSCVVDPLEPDPTGISDSIWMPGDETEPVSVWVQMPGTITDAEIDAIFRRHDRMRWDRERSGTIPSPVAVNLTEVDVGAAIDGEFDGIDRWTDDILDRSDDMRIEDDVDRIWDAALSLHGACVQLLAENARLRRKGER